MGKLGRRLNKTKYYAKNATLQILPNWLYKIVNPVKLNVSYIAYETKIRIDYYIKISSKFDIKKTDNTITIRHFKKSNSSVYYYDLLKTIRYFPLSLKFNYLPGDVTHIPNTPTFVKSRPICDNNQNSVLLKLNQVRHYYYEKDLYSFFEKKPLLIWRGADYQPHRIEFLERHFDNKRCNIGSVGNKASNFKKDFMSIQEQLAYKYVMSIEGNDVATNLKWIFKSNSLCIMRKPRFETWFMEGTLQAGVHYIEVKDDFSDLDEKLDWCDKHPDECLKIIHNANSHAAQFDNEQQEELISLLVVQKYFQLSGQLAET